LLAGLPLTVPCHAKSITGSGFRLGVLYGNRL